ncbi:hypothetical protein BRADI_3g10051v3 [Brachypodium distachyon]|uniref:DUF7597 domain-containing protein n=1 Tax=Brachypodium distachyon TaxID=15368 RepID=A0A0Q3I1J2_BRADI|nr:hypothetical protein BRADI_3g10051v3 [Brachypodium distachyon]
MAASFGRCEFRLTEESVGNLLNVCLGGSPEEFRICHLRQHTFRFSVTNKHISFHIAGLNSFTCINFVVYFHLWGFGGPDFIKEFAAWEKQEHLKWESPKKAQSPPRACRRTKEFDLADAGYSVEDIQQCKENHIAKFRDQQQKPVAIGTVFRRLTFPANSAASKPLLAPLPEKMIFEPQITREQSQEAANQGNQLGVHSNQGHNVSLGVNGPRPTCARCLKMGHHFSRCRNATHCRFYYKPGYTYRFCRARKEGATFAPTTRSSPMANFAVDPAPFVPGLFDIIDAERRPQHSRYHIRGRIEPQNEDATVVTLQPPPNPDALFEVTRGMLNHLLAEHLQLSAIGHAFVRLHSAIDRDCLVRNDAHQHNGIIFTFTEHNRAQNWRGFTYNQEVWLMILGIIIKVKVEDLSQVLYSLLLSHGPDFQGETWAAPVYFLHQAFMGALPPDEDAPPGDGDTPHPLPVLPFDEDHENNANHGPIISDLNMDADFWGPWDQALQNAGANAQDLLFLPEENQAAVIPNPAPNQDDESALTLSLSSNAPTPLLSEGSVNGIPPGPLHVMAHQGNQVLNLDLNVIQHEPPQNALDIAFQNAPEKIVQHVHLEDVLLQMPQDQDMHALHFIAAPNAQPADQIQLPAAANEHFHHDLQQDFLALYGPHLTKPNLELLHTSTDSNEIWIKHFFPRSNNNSISVPQSWVDFITASLISPDSFEWARKLITIEIYQRKERQKSPLVVTEVRRSERINQKNGGYKHNTCVDRHCLACSAKPPEISKKIIRNLSERFGLAKNDTEPQSRKKKLKHSHNDDDDDATKKAKHDQKKPRSKK